MTGTPTIKDSDIRRRLTGLRAIFELRSSGPIRATQVMNMIRAGVPRNIAMEISGHKTESIFNRYHIVETADVKRALVQTGEETKLGKRKARQDIRP